MNGRNAFIQAVQVGKNATAILSLDCVTAARKVMGELIFDISSNGNVCQARKGDWIVQDYQGKWHVEPFKA